MLMGRALCNAGGKRPDLPEGIKLDLRKHIVPGGRPCRLAIIREIFYAALHRNLVDRNKYVLHHADRHVGV